jgi:hypothetical protein
MVDFESVTGMGVRASVEGARVEVGADRFMRDLGVDITLFATLAAELGTRASRRCMPPSTAAWPRSSRYPIRSSRARRPPSRRCISWA